MKKEAAHQARPPYGPCEGVCALGLFYKDFADCIALTTDHELTCGGSCYAHALEVEVFHGSVCICISCHAVDTASIGEHKLECA